MKNTPAHQTLILNALRRKNLNQADLAKAIGKTPTAASRLLSGATKTIDDEMRIKIESFLGIRFFPNFQEGKFSAMAAQIAARFDTDAGFAAVVQVLNENMIAPVLTPRYVPTPEMGKLGRKVAAIVNDPKNADKYGKIARQVLELLA